MSRHALAVLCLDAHHEMFIPNADEARRAVVWTPDEHTTNVRRQVAGVLPESGEIHSSPRGESLFPAVGTGSASPTTRKMGARPAMSGGAPSCWNQSWSRRRT